VLADSGAFDFIKSLGWQVGIEHNNPYAEDAWEYEKLVLRTAAKSLELNLRWDFAVVHTDEAGGKGHAYPYDVAPENRGPDDPPTFASVLNKVFDFYNNVTSVDIPADPAEFQLFQNYPNPFNPETTMRYLLAGASHVELAIFDVTGRRVRTLVQGRQSVGAYTVTWDGRDEHGQAVASGIYFYRLTTTGQVQVRRMVLLR
jgi:hypothetical protein